MKTRKTDNEGRGCSSRKERMNTASVPKKERNRGKVERGIKQRKRYNKRRSSRREEDEGKLEN